MFCTAHVHCAAKMSIPSKILNAIDHLNNYSPENVIIDENEPCHRELSAFIEPVGCSQELEDVFDDSIGDSEYCNISKIDVWSALKGVVDCYILDGG